MRKLFSIMFVVVVLAGISFGQGYQKGVNNLNIGIGFGDVVGGYGSQDFPPISVGLQFGIHEKISVGGIVGYSTSSESWFYGKYKYSYIIIGARGEYHFMEPSDKLDLYAGVTLGYNIVSSSWEANNGYSGYSATASGSDLFYGFHAGARYAFTPTFGAYAEVGYGLGIVNVGVNFKL